MASTVRAADLYVETENTPQMTAPMQVASDAVLTNIKFIYVPNGTGSFTNSPGPGMVAYSVNIPANGTYVLWGRAIAPSNSDDSFFVQVNNGTNIRWDLANGTTWHWTKLKASFALTAGTHIIKVKQREDGAQLDKILLTSNLNLVPTDTLAAAVCGNGKVESPEACDDGNLTSEDGCSSLCVKEFCGDNIVQAGLGEECENGTTASCVTSTGYTGTQSCQSTCTLGSCVTAQRCGDGVVQGPEKCDDGNTAGGDGCSSTCVTEISSAGANGLTIETENMASLVAPMQLASDTNASGGKFIQVPSGAGSSTGTAGTGLASYFLKVPANGTYILWGRVIAPSGNDDSFFAQVNDGTDIRWDLTNGTTWHWTKLNASFALAAGTHVIKIKQREDGAQLDQLILTSDPSFVPTDTTSSQTNTDTNTAACGNGVLETGETCDPGNISIISCTTSGGYAGTKSCQSNCTFGACTAVGSCGDGVVQTTEECDDGNAANGDGCSSQCTIEHQSTSLDQAGMSRVQSLETKLNNMTIIPTHPRIFLNQEKLAALRAKSGQAAWKAVLAKADQGDLINSALGYLMLEQNNPGQALIYATNVFNMIANATYTNWCATSKNDQQPRINVAVAALAFDWVYNGLTDAQRTILINKLAAAADIVAKKKEIDDGVVPAATSTACYKHNTTGETFHREEWVFYAYEAWPEIALAGHYSGADVLYKSRWNYRWYWGDAARAEAYVNDGTPFEGYYFGNDGISWFTALESATGVNLIDGPAVTWNSDAAYYMLYRFDVSRSFETMHKGVATSTSAVNSFLKSSSDTWKLREHISRTFLPRAKKDPYLQWVINNKLDTISSWIMTNNYYNSISALAPIAKLLFYDETAPQKDPTTATYAELPFDRHFAGGNEAYMRTGWGPKAAIVGFRSKPAFTMTSHSDFDVNTFVIHRDGGPLAPDSGVYDAYEQQKNYFEYQKNTVAHNDLLVIDPANPDGPKKLSNSTDPGGTDLRTSRTFSAPTFSGSVFVEKDPTANWADITKFETQPGYAYLVSDGHEAYGSRLSKYDRNLAFLRKGNDEGYLIIFDRVTATNATYKKKWLLHTVGEPVLNGNIVNTQMPGHIETYDGDTMTATNQEGTSKLSAKFLLPAGHSVRRVSGEILHTNGTVNVAYSGDKVIGNGTTFTQAMVGHYFHVNKDKTSTTPSGYDGYYDWYQIKSVEDAAHLTLSRVYTQTAALSEPYTINQGYQFWVDATTPRNDFVTGATKAMSTSTVTGKAWQHMGQGRIELMPPNGNKTDYFLVAMNIGDINSVMPANTSRIDTINGDPMYGVLLDSKVVMFGQTGSVVTQTSFQVGYSGVVDFLITDLNPGQTYSVRKGGATIFTRTASSQGTISFSDNPGLQGAIYNIL